jgi:iron complex outermembrane receptor protein
MLILNTITRRIFSLLAFPIAIGVAFSAMSLPAFAQDEDEELLDEIIVTSRFREENIQQTPIAITAITGEELEIRAFAAAYEIGYTVPNASLRPAQAAFGNTMTAFIRGIGQYDFNFAFEPGVGIYIDDVYHPFTMGSQIDLLDLDRVEVLRGPQGTLFGRGAIGGAIRYVTKRPQGDGSGNIQLTYGDYDRVDVRASYDFALVEDRLFARVAGVSKSRDGHQDVIDFACARPSEAGNLLPLTPNLGRGCKVGTQGGEDITGVRAQLRLVANEKLEFGLTLDYLDDNSEARADTLTDVGDSAIDDFYRAFVLGAMLGLDYDERFLPPNPYVTYATYSDPISTLKFEPVTAFEKEAISGLVDWDISDNVNAKLIVASTDITSRFATDADASPLNMQTVDGFQEIESDTIELRVSGRAMDRLDWTVGGFYYDGSADSNQTVSIPWLTMFLDQFLPNAFGPSVLLGEWTFEEAADALHSDWEHYTFVKSNNLHDFSHESFFAHLVFELTDNISVNVGGRASDDEKHVQFDNTRVVNPSVTVSNSRTDWRVGLDFQMNDDILLYGSASTGYRPGAYNPRPFQVSQVVAVDPEEATSYDIGVKMDLFDNTLRLNLAAFIFDYEQRILPAGGTECVLLSYPPPVYDTVDPSTPGAIQDSNGNWCLATVPMTFYVNTPADITGFEGEILWRPTDALTISGQIGTIDWESPDIDTCTGCVSDTPIYVPDQNWAVGINYDIPLPNGGTLSPRVDAYGQSEICAATFSLPGCVDGYELVNASILWDSGDQGWQVQLGVTNLTDEDYFLNAFDLVQFGQQTVEKQPGRPQEWYVTLRRFFD